MFSLQELNSVLLGIDAITERDHEWIFFLANKKTLSFSKADFYVNVIEGQGVVVIEKKDNGVVFVIKMI